MTESTWKSTPPDAVGLYIASVERRPDFVRFWTGKHWSPPLAVRDLHLTDRIPGPHSGPARDERGRAPCVEWLELVTIDREGFVSWGGLLDECPAPKGAQVHVKLRSGARSEWAVPARGVHWRADGSVLDPVAYRIACLVAEAA